MEPNMQDSDYVRYIDEHKVTWWPPFITRFHLWVLEFSAFLEDERDQGKTFARYMVKFYYSVVLRRSSMHGSYHLRQIKRHPFEIIFWGGVMIFASTYSLSLVSLFWDRYYYHPTVMSIERDYMNWNISFPAITICNNRKLNKTALYEYVSTSNATNKRQLAIFVRQLVDLTYDTIGDVNGFPYLHSEDYLGILNRVTNNIEAEITTTRNETYPLQRVVTEMGICYAFNWNIWKYFSPSYFLQDRMEDDIDEYLVTNFDLEKVAFLRDVPNCCVIYTHDSLDTLNSRRKLNVRGGITTFTLIRFNAIPIVASQSVRKLRIEQRMCRYLSESNLQHFPVYTFSLCRIECKINAILELCQCVPFFYKKLPGEKSCDSNGLKCVATYRDVITRIVSKCDCPSNCEDTKFVLDEFSSLFWMLPSAIRIELTNTKTKLRRNVFFRIVDVVVSTGNVYSLFLGISMLSFVEFFYFTFIRLPIQIVQQKWKQKTRRIKII